MAWTRACNDLIERVVELYPGEVRRRLPAAAVARRAARRVRRRARALRERAGLRRLQPEPGPVRRPLELARRSPTGTGTRSTRRWSSSTCRRWCTSRARCNPNFHATGAHYINADTTAFMQFIQGDLFKDFPTLRFIIPHGGGAVPYHWGRYRGLADMLKQPPLSEHVMKNVFFDTCVYHQPGIDLLCEVIDVDNILFGSEMVGAVRGIDPETGHYFDDTKRYIDALAAARRRQRARSSRATRGGSTRASTQGPARARTLMRRPTLHDGRRLAAVPPRPAQARATCRRRARSTRTATCSARATSSPTRRSASTRPCDARQGAAVRAARLPRLRPQRHRPGDLPRRRQPRPGRRAARGRGPGPRRGDRPAAASPTASWPTCTRPACAASASTSSGAWSTPSRDDVLPRHRRARSPRSAGTSSSTSRPPDLAERWRPVHLAADDRRRRPHGPPRRDAAASTARSSSCSCASCASTRTSGPR